jgi:hypothetical protein
MPMTTTEARELRAALVDALDPLYAARTGTIPAMQGVTAAIVQLHKIDKALLNVINGAGQPVAFTPEERAWLLDSVVSSQALAGVEMTTEQAGRILDELAGRPLPEIGTVAKE